MPIAAFPKLTDVFIETGSYKGDGIAKAIEAGFKKIISIEAIPDYFNHCFERFKYYKQVTLILGDSSEVLEEIIRPINEPITFWLDAHLSEGDKNKDKVKQLSPLIQELEIILRHPHKHIILIDDLYCWKGMDDIFHKGFNLETIKTLLKDYKTKVIDGEQMEQDILLAWHGSMTDSVLSMYPEPGGHHLLKSYDKMNGSE